jgi:hypothetical protein
MARKRFETLDPREFAKQVFGHLEEMQKSKVSSKTPIGRIAQSAYGNGMSNHSLTKERSKELTRRRMPVGNGFAMLAARGLIRWRESKGLSVVEATAKYGYGNDMWFKFERGTHPSLTGKNIDQLCEAIGIDVMELLKLGKQP